LRSLSSDGMRQLGILLKKELCQLLASRSLLAMLLIFSPLVGYSFIQAVSLFSEASRSALQHTELAPGMNPLDGVLVPTLGSLYLVTTLLFPFVAIRPIGMERQTGSLKLVLQFPGSVGLLVAAKAIAVFVLWVGALSPALLALCFFGGMGGHIHPLELVPLLLGHALYAFVILGAAFLISALADSASTAAILILGLTLGSWVLDFAAGSQSPGLLRDLSQLSLTASIRSFERGLFSFAVSARLLIMGVALLTSTAACLHAGDTFRSRAKRSAGILVTAILACFLVSAVPWYRDFSEDRRNSLPPEDETALRQMTGHLKIFVFLSPDDPRYRDLERQLFSKFRRLISGVEIRLMDTGKTALFGVGGGDDYGLNRYEYEGKAEESRSTSPREILPLLSRLAGKTEQGTSSFFYPGYPLVADAERFSRFSFMA